MKKTVNIIQFAFLVGVILFAMGCSRNEGWNSPTSPTAVTAPVNVSVIAFDGMQIDIPEGWELVQIPQQNSLDTPRPRSEGGRIGESESIGDAFICSTERAQRDTYLNQIHLNWTGCWIPGAALPRNRMDIEVCVDSLQAVCEFGPHGTLFNSDIWVRIDFQYLGLDQQDIDLENDVAIFYVQDNGLLEEMPHWVDWTGHALVGLTNHFSRYIITTRTM
ncbi:MAG: hypothetical protein IPG71_10110 [bacterium]|nr:hypothetical protein [bacterium]